MWRWFRNLPAVVQWGALAVLLVVYVGVTLTLTKNDKSGVTSSGGNTVAQPATVRTPEQDLNIVDRSASVSQYSDALGRLEPKCRETRRAIADLAAAGRETVRQRVNRNVPMLDMLNQMERAVPAGTQQSCSDVATALVILMTQ